MLGFIFVLAILIAPTVFSFTATAAEFGTKEEALAMVKRVQQKFKAEGPDRTFQAITANTKEFHDRDLYVYVIDLNGVNHAHGARPELVGKNMIDYKDQNGKFFIREAINLCNTAGSGWFDLRFLNPITQSIDDKASYVERMGDRYCMGVGIYRNEQVNENTVGIIAGSPSSDDTSFQAAHDLAIVLNDKDNLRILPVAGIGGPQNIRDVRNLKGIDIGLTQVNVLNSFRRSNEQILGHFDNKIVYITELFNEEAHLVARADITSIEQLRGQKVNLDEEGSGTTHSMRDVFQRLGIKVEAVAMTQADALEKLKSGEIAATVLFAGKPARSMTKIKASDGVHFLSIPFSAALVDDYLPATLNHNDYPEIIAQGQSVDTVAVATVLIAYNWPKNSDRYRRVQKFVEAFFPRISDFQKPPRHSKWREVNLAANLPGWTRFEPAEVWLAGNRTSSANQEADPPSAQPVSASDDEQLYKEFLLWRRARQGH